MRVTFVNICGYLVELRLQHLWKLKAEFSQTMNTVPEFFRCGQVERALICVSSGHVKVVSPRQLNTFMPRGVRRTPRHIR
jgi:hypothetical protein